MYVCKRRLTLVWFIGAGLVYLVVLIQTLLDHYDGRVSDVWAWLLPATLPTLSLIASVWTMDTLGKGSKIESADSFVFWLAFALSTGYLFVITLTILIQPLVASTIDGYIAAMNRSNLFIGPFQGVVAASLGAFFLKNESKAASNAGESKD
jgi:hypothetical protein